MRSMKTAFLAAALLSSLLLTGCAGGPRPATPATPAPSSSSEDTTGQLVPQIGMNGKLGVGIDMGGGLTLSPSGGFGLSLGS